MRVLYFILYTIAAVLFAAAAFLINRPRAGAPDALSLVALGLFASVLVPLIQLGDRLGD